MIKFWPLPAAKGDGRWPQGWCRGQRAPAAGPESPSSEAAPPAPARTLPLPC